MRPDDILSNLDTVPAMQIADFGCGAGYFTIPLAKKVGREGKVYAVDVQESALDSVRGRAKMSGLLNIETIRGNLENKNGSKLPGASMDMVVMANILFQTEKKEAILEEAKRVLKKTGKVVIVEWSGSATLGPRSRYRISKEDLKALVKAAGLILEKEFPAGSSHYGLIFSL